MNGCDIMVEMNWTLLAYAFSFGIAGGIIIGILIAEAVHSRRRRREEEPRS